MSLAAPASVSVVLTERREDMKKRKKRKKKKNKGAVTKKEWIEFFIIGAISLTVIGLYSGWPNP